MGKIHINTKNSGAEQERYGDAPTGTFEYHSRHGGKILEWKKEGRRSRYRRQRGSWIRVHTA